MKSCYGKRHIKSHVPQPSRPHTFLHKTNTSGVKIRPVFMNHNIDLIKIEYVKN